MNSSAARAWGACLTVAAACSACNWEWKDQVVQARYANYAEASRADAISKGWIPDFLPKSATNILEWHNVETDRSRTEFSFDTMTDSEWVTRFFKPAMESQAKLLNRELLQSRGATISLQGTLRFFELSERKGEQGYLAINYEQGRAQYWTRPE
jgi:hypothetical protein